MKKTKKIYITALLTAVSGAAIVSEAKAEPKLDEQCMSRPLYDNYKLIEQACDAFTPPEQANPTNRTGPSDGGYSS